MIIKKKYIDTINKEQESDDINNLTQSETVQETNEIEIIQTVEEKDELEKEVKTNENEPDLNLSIEDITFEPRQERREGTRRRGYRRTQDRNIVSRAQQDAASIKEAAKQDGYKEGIIQAQQEIELFKTALNEFFNYKDKVFDSVSACILDIAVEIAKKIINKEIENDNHVIISMIRGALEEVNKTENKITLKVMPKDVEIVKDSLPEIFTDGTYEAKITVIPDNGIKEGGVIIETSNGIIDATIESQMEIMKKALNVQTEKG